MSRTKPTPSEIIAAADASLENANEHGTSAQGIWDSVKDFMPRQTHKFAARALADHLASDWEHFIVNVTGGEDDET